MAKRVVEAIKKLPETPGVPPSAKEKRTLMEVVSAIRSFDPSAATKLHKIGLHNVGAVRPILAMIKQASNAVPAPEKATAPQNSSASQSDSSAPATDGSTGSNSPVPSKS